MSSTESNTKTIIELSESRLQQIQAFEEDHPDIALEHYADLVESLLSALPDIAICKEAKNRIQSFQSEAPKLAVRCYERLTGHLIRQRN